MGKRGMLRILWIVRKSNSVGTSGPVSAIWQAQKPAGAIYGTVSSIAALDSVGSPKIIYQFMRKFPTNEIECPLGLWPFSRQRFELCANRVSAELQLQTSSLGGVIRCAH